MNPFTERIYYGVCWCKESLYESRDHCSAPLCLPVVEGVPLTAGKWSDSVGLVGLIKPLPVELWTFRHLLKQNWYEKLLFLLYKVTKIGHISAVCVVISLPSVRGRCYLVYGPGETESYHCPP